MSDFESTPSAPANPTEQKEAAIAEVQGKSATKFISRFTMSTPLVVGDQARPDIESLLMFGIHRDNPRIQVTTRDPSDQENNYGRIVAAMDPGTWEVLVSYVLELADEANARNGKEHKVIENSNLYKGKERFDTPQLVNTTIVARTEDGRICIKIKEDGRPSPVFYFGPPKFHNLVNADRSQVDPGKASRLYARATVKALSQIFTTMIGIANNEPKAQANAKVDVKGAEGGKPSWQGNNGGNGGGWKGNGGGNGNWGNRQGFNRGNGGGGWNNNRGGGNGGNWNNNRGGNGGGGWNNNRGGGNGSWGNRPQQGQQDQSQARAAQVSDTDINF